LLIFRAASVKGVLLIQIPRHEFALGLMRIIKPPAGNEIELINEKYAAAPGGSACS
jgi:hypothetical protein